MRKSLAALVATAALLSPAAALAGTPQTTLSIARATRSATKYVGGPVQPCTRINRTAVQCKFYEPGAPRPTDEWGEPPYLFTAVVILHAEQQIVQVKTAGEPPLGFVERV